jgi:hypothetical protein
MGILTGILLTLLAGGVAAQHNSKVLLRDVQALTLQQVRAPCILLILAML